MARNGGNSVVAGLLVALTFVLFVPAALEASGAAAVSSYQFSGQIGLLFEYLPLLFAVMGVLILALSIDKLT
jgi:hypothetical protein